MIYLKNSNIPLKHAYNDKLVEEKNGRFDLEFVYPLTDDTYKQFKKFDLLTAKTPKLDYQDFYITNIEKINNGVKVYAKHVFFLTSKLFVKKLESKSTTGADVFRKLSSCISDENKFVFYSDLTEVHGISMHNAMLYDVLMNPDSSIINLWKGTYKRDNYNISLLSRRGIDTEYIIAKRKNISDIKINENADFVVTRLYLRGKKRTNKKEGEEKKEEWFETVIDSPFINEYPYIFSQYREYGESFRSIGELERYGERLFSVFKIDLPKETFTLKCTDEINSYNLDINDTVLIYYEDYNVHKKIEVTKYVYSPIQSRYLELTFGYRSRSLADTLTITTNKKIEREAKKIHQLSGLLTENMTKVDVISSNINSIEEKIEDKDKEIDEKISEQEKVITENVKLKLEAITANLQNYIKEKLKTIDIDEEKIKALSNAETEKYIRSKEGQAELIKAITADVVWLNSVITNTELLNTIVANIDIAKIKKAIIDTAFIESIVSEERFRQEFENGGVNVVNIFSKMKDSILTYLQANFDDEFGNIIASYNTVLETKINEINLAIQNTKRRFTDIEGEISFIKEESGSIKLRTDSIENTLYTASVDVDVLMSEDDINILKDNSYKKILDIEKNQLYELKTTIKGDCDVLIKFYNDNDKRKYKYKYPKKFKNYAKVIKEVISDGYVDRIISFKVPENTLKTELVIKAREDTHVKNIKLGKNGIAVSLDKISQLKQTLDGFKFSVENNLDGLRSYVIQKDNEITHHIQDTKKGIETTVKEELGKITEKITDVTEVVEENKENINQTNNKIDTTKTELKRFATTEIEKKAGEINVELTEKIGKSKESAEETARTLINAKAGEITENLSSVSKKVVETNNKIDDIETVITTQDGKIIKLDNNLNKTKVEMKSYTDAQIVKNSREFSIELNEKIGRTKEEAKQTANTLINAKAGELTISVNKAREDAIDAKYKANRLEGELDDKVSKGNVVVEINKEPGYLKIDADKVDITGTLRAYRGEIGSFVLGKFYGKTGTWFTTEDYQTGMGGTGNKIALWVNWGSDWNTPGWGSWYIGKDGQMYCYNNVHFYQGVNIDGISLENYIKKIVGNSGSNSVTSSNINSIETAYQSGWDGTYLYTRGYRDYYVRVTESGSDRRYKRNITESKINATKVLNNLKCFEYDTDFPNTPKKHIKCGIMAQDVEEHAKEAYYKRPDDIKSYDTFELIPYTIKAIQELSEENKQIKQENKILKSQVQNFMIELEKIKQKIGGIENVKN